MDKDLLYISDLDGTLLLPDGSFPEDALHHRNRPELRFRAPDFKWIEPEPAGHFIQWGLPYRFQQRKYFGIFSLH